MAHWTIGELARRVGLKPSALRFYEAEGLLFPIKRSENGYRLYAPEAEQTLRFIHRAQQLGFSLSDIRTILQDQPPDQELLLYLAEQRFLALERQITSLLILRHELELFLQDFNHLHLPESTEGSSVLDRFTQRIGTLASERSSADATLDWLLAHTGCNLVALERHSLLEALRGQHIHIWQEGEHVQIMVFGMDPKVEQSLRELARIEADCQAHSNPQLTLSESGYLLTVRGDSAFVFARLFLALQAEKP